jgi:hypothetical protein
MHESAAQPWPPPAAGPIRLDHGHPAGRKVAFTVAGAIAGVVPFSIGLGLLAGVASGQIDSARGAAIVVALLFLGLALALALALIKLWRGGVLLEGTVLVLRGLRTRRIELTGASVMTDSIPAPTGHRIPLLRITPARGRPARLRLLTGTGSLLPPADLNALAGAIAAGAMPSPDGDGARRVAETLHQLADNPAARLL